MNIHSLFFFSLSTALVTSGEAVSRDLNTKWFGKTALWLAWDEVDSSDLLRGARTCMA